MQSAEPPAVPAPAPEPTGTVDASFRRRAVRAAAAGLVGTSIEWYDYFLYGSAAAVVFPRLFFGNLDGAVALIFSLATFSVAFALRPIGGFIFGHFGDRLGRKRMLVVTLVLMGAGTFLIGCLPTQHQIGVTAPILLIALRTLQGLGLGGEWGGAALVVVENAPAGRRGIYGCAMQIGVPIGQLMSAGLFAGVASLPDEQFYSWGWRIPFWFSAVLVAVGFWLRARLTETPHFQQVVRTGQRTRIPALEVLRSAKKPTVLLIFVQAGSTVAYYLLTVYSLVYVTDHLHLPRSWALGGVLLGAGLEICTQPFFAWLSDRFGRRPVYGAGTLFLALYAFPFFWLLDTAREPLVWLAIVLGLALGHAATGALHGPLYAEQFPARFRYTGSSLAYQLSSTVAGAPAPILAGLLVSVTGTSRATSVYVVVACIVSLVCVALLRETYRANLNPQPQPQPEAA